MSRQSLSVYYKRSTNVYDKDIMGSGARGAGPGLQRIGLTELLILGRSI